MITAGVTKNTKVCSVPQCGNYFHKGDISFHKLPNDPGMRKKWEAVLQLRKPGSTLMFVCGQHFTRQDFFPRRVEAKRWTLFPHAVPSQRLPVDNPPASQEEKKGVRASKRKAKKKNKDDGTEENAGESDRSSTLPKKSLVEKGFRCSAPGCPNSKRNCRRVFRFPSEPTRRKAWETNCWQALWKPPLGSHICELHFTEDQWVLKEEVDDKILKPDAVPFIFFLPTDLEDTRKEPLEPDYPTSSFLEEDMDSSSSEGFLCPVDPSPQSPEERPTSELLEEIAWLKEQLRKKDLVLKLFLSDDQIEALENDGTNSRPESAEDFKLQLNLETEGLNLLCSKNYPLPAIVALNIWLRDTEVHFGVFEELAELIQHKVQALDPLDRLCSLSLEKLSLSGLKGQKKTHSNDDKSKNNFITVVLIRGIKSPWEQVIACESYAHEADGMSQVLLDKSINFAEECGLRVLSASSNCTLMWSALGVDVTKRESERTASFYSNDHEIHVVPDVRNLLKSLKMAVDTGVALPMGLVDDEALPSYEVTTKHVRELWDSEDIKSSGLLSHLQKDDVKSTTNRRTTFESAIRFFSIKTAVALESAVSSNMITPDALSTAYFCRLIDKWYTICDSRSSEDGITHQNKQVTFNFLRSFIRILQDVKIGDGWSPTNAGMIMSTMSLCKVADILLQQDGFGVVFLHRFSLDAIHNVISQIRLKSDVTLTALEFLKELKTVTAHQFTAEVSSSYERRESDLVAKESETLESLGETTREKRVRRPTQKGKLMNLMKASKTTKLDLKKSVGRPRKKVAKS